ncbi:MAG: bacterial transcriptional activator domain-containing protein [Oscillospiraceae bacterium]|nr:bacterial transcriptional activator domain-containing protein [Oscillospiraceae bacterium]
MYPSKNIKIEIQMFGEFSITINGKTLTKLKGRTKRVWMLIQYLIVHRSATVPLNRMLRDIWDGRTCGDPENALKNLVYRARTLLRDLAGDQSQFIVFINGTYAWNNRHECKVDSELFLEAVEKARSKKVSDEKRIQCYRKALRLYQNGFLPKSSYSKWVILQSTRYRAMYLSCVKGLCALLSQKERYDEVVPVCEAALRLFPYEESMHILLMRACSNAGCSGKAFDHYDHAVKLFYQEFGVNLSGLFKPCVGKRADSSRPQTDLESIRGDLQEKTKITGAFLCDYDMFKCLYRSQVRMMPRTGLSIFLVLFTLTGSDGRPPEPEALRVASDKLKEAILTGMRRGDVVASCSATQYIAMLETVISETAEGVVQRVMRKFRFGYRRDAVRVVTKAISIIE